MHPTIFPPVTGYYHYYSLLVFTPTLVNGFLRKFEWQQVSSSLREDKVHAANWHTCPDPHLGSWNCLPHQAHIALSEPMSSTDKQGSSLGSFPTSPPLYPHFNRLSGFWPCVKSCLVGGSDKYWEDKVHYLEGSLFFSFLFFFFFFVDYHLVWSSGRN